MGVLYEEWQPWRRQPFIQAVMVFFLAFAIVMVVLAVRGDAGWSEVVPGPAAALALLLFFLAGGLRTSVRDDALIVNMIPLRRRKVPWDEVARIEAVRVRPLREFGGWGIRYGGRKRGWIYNVQGTGAIRVTYADGRHLVVGSQDPDALVQAIQAVVTLPKEPSR